MEEEVNIFLLVLHKEYVIRDVLDDIRMRKLALGGYLDRNTALDIIF